MSIFDGVKKLLSDTSSGKIIRGAGSDYVKTTYATDIIPEYETTTGQKRFQTKSPIMNLPKVETMFFVYFSLNPETHNMLEKKRSLIQYIASKTAGQVTVGQNEEKNLANRSKIAYAINAVTQTVASGLENVSKMLGLTDTKNNNEDKKTQSLPTEKDSKTFADFLPEKFILNQLSFELSKYVREIDKPTIEFSVNEYNEYNRRRLCYDKKKFNPITITFYDVKDNPVQQFFFTYLKIINNDFLAKDFYNFRKQIVTDDFDYDIADWGFDTDSNFRLIDKISVCEYYMDKMMVYTMENPVMKSINFGKSKIGSFDANTVTVSFEYEGLTNDLLDINPHNVVWEENKATLKAMINRDISSNMASFLNVRYKSGEAMGIDTAVSFIKGVLDAPSEERWNVIKSQSLDTLRKLGFGQEVQLYNKTDDAINEFKDSDNKGKFLLKLSDDPSSIIGQIGTGGSSSTSTKFIKSFF